MKYHVTYIDGQGRTQVGRVSVADDVYVPSSTLRRRAMQAARWTLPDARRVVSAVACPGRPALGRRA